jgi:predicted transcriptional regulator
MTSTALTGLQLAVMNALWKVGEGSVADVHAALAEDGTALAPTTVATMLQRMSKQGWVASHKVGRHFVYRAQVDRKQAASGALRRVLGGFFGGSLSALTAQLLESEQLSAEELAEMRKLLAEKEG